MKPIHLSAVIFGFGISAIVLERAHGQCCFNINAYGGGRGVGGFYGWKSPIWQGVEGAFHLSSSDGDYKKPSEFCFNLQDKSLTDSSGRKCHVQKETGQLRCLHDPLGHFFHWFGNGDGVKLMTDNVKETDHTVELVDSFNACPSDTSDEFNIHALLPQQSVDARCIHIILHPTVDCLPQEETPPGVRNILHRQDISQPERMKRAVTLPNLTTLTHGDLADLTLSTPLSDPNLITTISPLRRDVKGHGEPHCPVDLSGDYIAPKHIVKIDAVQPRRTWLASNHVKICKAVSAVYTFDVPVAWTGKKCELLFLLPNPTNMNYTLKKGQLGVGTFKGVVGEVASFASLPYKGKDSTAFDVESDKRVVLKTEDCKPGLVSFDLEPKKKLCLEFEQADGSEHPIGLFYTACAGTLVAKDDWLPSKIKSLTSKVHSVATKATDIVASEFDDIVDAKVVRSPVAKVDGTPAKVASLATKVEGVTTKIVKTAVEGVPSVASRISIIALETGDAMSSIFDAKAVETPAAKLDWPPATVLSVASDVVDTATKVFDDFTSKLDDWFGDDDRA